jgi:amino acid transporter
MSEKQPQSHRLLAIIGLLLSMVGLFGYYFIMRAANNQVITSGAGAMIIFLWALLCALAFLFCLFGFRKSKVGSKLLAIIGMIIGVFVFVISVWSGITIQQAASNPELQRIREKLGTGYDEELLKLKGRLDRKEIIEFPIKDTLDTVK